MLVSLALCLIYAEFHNSNSGLFLVFNTSWKASHRALSWTIKLDQFGSQKTIQTLNKISFHENSKEQKQLRHLCNVLEKQKQNEKTNLQRLTSNFKTFLLMVGDNTSNTAADTEPSSIKHQYQ